MGESQGTGGFFCEGEGRREEDDVRGSIPFENWGKKGEDKIVALPFCSERKKRAIERGCAVHLLSVLVKEKGKEREGESGGL